MSRATLRHASASNTAAEYCDRLRRPSSASVLLLIALNRLTLDPASQGTWACFDSVTRRARCVSVASVAHAP